MSYPYIREMRMSDMNDLYDITLLSLDEAFLPDVFYGFYGTWPEGQFVSADLTGRPTGYICSSRLMDGGVRVMMFAVHPNHRGKGIGTALLNSLIERCRMSGYRYITLEVRKENRKARQFYQKNGFIETGTLDHYYRDGGDGVRMDRMLY